MMMARSLTQIVELHVALEILKYYIRLSFSNHRKSGSRKMMKRYGLSVSSCIIPMFILIGGGICVGVTDTTSLG